MHKKWGGCLPKLRLVEFTAMFVMGLAWNVAVAVRLEPVKDDFL